MSNNDFVTFGRRAILISPAPFIVIGAVVTALSMFAKDPRRSAQRLGTGAAPALSGGALIFGIRAARI